MFSINPFTVLKEFKNYSWYIILFALFIIVPYFLLWGPFKAYKLIKAEKDSEREAVVQSLNDAIANVDQQMDWNQVSEDVEKERSD